MTSPAFKATFTPVSNLVERHGGAIGVHSDGVGQRSTFTVELPVVAAAPARAAPPPAQSAAARSRLRVLVVDDNVDVADLLFEALSLEGFDTAVKDDRPSSLRRISFTRRGEGHLSRGDHPAAADRSFVARHTPGGEIDASFTSARTRPSHPGARVPRRIRP